MFSSPRSGNDSPVYKSRSQKYLLNDSNGLSKSLMSSAVTSTPLHSISMNNRRASSLLSPARVRRFSLSEAVMTPPKYLNSIEPNMTKLIQNSSGPLLASTQYNINLSTYVDSKSPGYASRVVQYSEERDRSLPTHQSKYGSPGVFPVVHLFKKDLPLVSPKPRKVTIRIAPSDCSRYNTPEHNRLLLEGIVQESNRSNHHNNEVGTRSVLDALKEISRKRIHPGEEYDINEESVKRLRSDCFNGGSGDSFRRSRDDDLTDGISQYKKICYIDPFYASSTSTALERERLQRMLTVPDDKTNRSVQVESFEEKNDDIKLVNVETQTIPDATPSTPTEFEEDSVTDTDKVDITSKRQDETEVEKPVRKQRKAPLRIFDEKPLEIMRKNKLAVLLGALTGEKPILIPKEDKLAKFREEMEREEEKGEKDKKQKPDESPQIKSILSTGSRKSDGAEKHVTFSSSTFTSPVENTLLPIPTTTQTSVKFPSPSITQTSTSVITPLMSASVCDSPKSIGSGDAKLTPSLNGPIGSSVLQPSTTFTFGTPSEAAMQSGITSPATFGITRSDNSFSSASNIPKVPEVPSSTQVPSLITPSTTGSATFKFDTPSTTATKSMQLSATLTATTSAEPKAGGFKFDLTKPSSPANTATSQLNFKGAAEKPETMKSMPSILGGSQTIAPTNMFGQTTHAAGFSVGSTDIPPVISTTSTNFPSNSFAAPLQTSGSVNNMFNKDASKPTSFGMANDSSASNTSSGFKFAGPNNNSKFNSPVPTNSQSGYTSPSSQPSFGISTSGPTFAFGQGANTTVTTSLSSNAPGFVSSTSSGFGPSTNAPFFGNANTPFASPVNTTDKLAVPSFGATNINNITNVAPGFGSSIVSSTSSFDKTSGSAGFGSAITTTSAGFGVPSNNISPFGSNTTGFGSSNNLSFGATTNSTTIPSGFGTTSSPPAFGSSATPSGFGVPTAGSAFGPTTTANTSGFVNSPSSSMFNAPNTTNSISTTSSVPVFGNVSNSAFGNKSAAFSFGGGNHGSSTTSTPNLFNTSTTASASSFTSTSKPAFGIGGGNTSSGFPNTSPPFGSANQPTTGFGTGAPFGAPTTTSAPAFGVSNNTSAFGNNTGSPFGTATTTSNTTPAFGSTNTTSAPMFGGSSTSAFGSSSAGFANSSKPLFGPASTSGFGNNSSITTTNSSVFGNNNAAPTFSFGAPTTTSSSSFGMNSSPAFGPSTTSGSSFGSNTTSAFGSTSTFGSGDSAFKSGHAFPSSSAFGTVNTTSGGLGTTSTPSFGSSSGFGSGSSSFGSTSTGAFGSSSAPAFGSNVATTNSFNSTSNSVFGGGFGSGTPSTFDSKPQTNFGTSTTSSFSSPTSTFGVSSSNPGFGSNIQSGPAFPSTSAQNGIFTFGASNTPQQQAPGGFSFGATEPPKPSFNFTAGSNAPSFGSSPAPAFGTNPSPAFGANPNGQFGGAPAMFSIGSGATSNRPRAKAKRRVDKF